MSCSIDQPTLSGTWKTHGDPRTGDYVESVQRAFERAAASAGGRIDRYFEIAGFTICLSFAGPALIPSITQAFQHLSAEPNSCTDLVVLLWDKKSTSIGMPKPPWDVDAYIALGEIWRYNGEHLKVSYQPINNMYYILEKSGLGVLQVEDADRIPQYEKGSPLLQILHWWTKNHGRALVHSGAVGFENGGALLVGKGGAGKSTAAAACIDSDLLYAGDDYCILSNDPSPHVHSVYGSGKIKSDDMGRFPFLKDAPGNSHNSDTGKTIFFLNNFMPRKLAKGFPIRTILIPQIAGIPETRFEKASTASAFRAIAISTVFQLSGSECHIFSYLSEVVRKVPCYFMKSGTNVTGIPAAVAQLLSELNP